MDEYVIMCATALLHAVNECEATDCRDEQILFCLVELSHAADGPAARLRADFCLKRSVWSVAEAAAALFTDE